MQFDTPCRTDSGKPGTRSVSPRISDTHIDSIRQHADVKCSRSGVDAEARQRRQCVTAYDVVYQCPCAILRATASHAGSTPRSQARGFSLPYSSSNGVITVMTTTSPPENIERNVTGTSHRDSRPGHRPAPSAVREVHAGKTGPRW